MLEELVSSVRRYKSWVAYPFVSDHAPVVLQFDHGQRLIAYPFKLNPIWLEEKGFSDLVVQCGRTMSST
jgi:hypothetical protein